MDQTREAQVLSNKLLNFKPEMANPTLSPLVSIVIPTNKEERNIGNCLRSIRCQSYKNIEIIVVDNKSEDGTREIALKYTDRVLEKVGGGGPLRRNFGSQAAKGTFLMAIDADMILSPDLVESCVLWMKQKGSLALYIPEIVLGKKYWSQVRRFERGFYDGTVVDAARFYRKDVYDHLGGWDEGLVGVDDWDFDKKLRRLGRVDLLDGAVLSVGAAPSADWELSGFLKERGVDPTGRRAVIYHNESEFDMRRYFGKKNYYMNTLDVYFGRWGRDDADVKKQFGFWYRYFCVFVEKRKWRRLSAHPLLALGMFFLRVMVGIVYAVNLWSPQSKGSAL